MKKWMCILGWVALAVLGAWAYSVLATHRNETVNSVYILIAAACTYALGFRFYSKWVATRVFMLDNQRATPCEVHDDGKDFVKTNPWIVFGHHFAAISGPGPLVGPVLAAQFGYLPGTIWILIGAVLGGAVQDFVILFASMRRNGKSLGQMVREEISSTAGVFALMAILAIIIILLAVLALVVVKALAESPWGIFTVGATIPIAMFMGGYMRWARVGKVMEASVIGVVLLLLAVWGGQYVHADKDHLAKLFTIGAEPLAWAVIIYGLFASILPVWLLLAPRDYLSTFMKLGTIFALALGCFYVLPDLQMPAISKFIDGTGLVVAGKLFPFCFITIACGAISGFHSLISSGITPKIITRENYSRTVGYGAMCLESLVAIMAMIAACTLDPGVYLSMNVKGVGADQMAIAADTVMKVNATGFMVTDENMRALATQVGENTLYGRTGGAATLAVGMAHIFTKVTGGRWMDLWYHFAIMFEALFILTTIDAGTRVGRYLLQDVLGSFWKPLGETKSIRANLLASTLMVCGWGYFLIQGVRDPLGGVNSLWPLFGIANQMLAAIALCLGTTIILKMHLMPEENLPVAPGAKPARGFRHPAMALVTFIPMLWLLAVTMTAGYQKIMDADPKIGFLAQAKALDAKLPALQQTLETARAAGNATALIAAEKAVHVNRSLHLNNELDAVMAGIFLVLVTLILILSVREWILLLAKKRLAQLHESVPVWLPDYLLAQSKPLHVVGLIALAIALIRELSGESAVERAYQHVRLCPGPTGQAVVKVDLLGGKAARERLARQQAYIKAAEERFDGIKRCC